MNFLKVSSKVLKHKISHNFCHLARPIHTVRFLILIEQVGSCQRPDSKVAKCQKVQGPIIKVVVCHHDVSRLLRKKGLVSKTESGKN